MPFFAGRVGGGGGLMEVVEATRHRADANRSGGFGRGGWRLKVSPTGGPHLSATTKEGGTQNGLEGPRPNGEGGSRPGGDRMGRA